MKEQRELSKREAVIIATTRLAMCVKAAYDEGELDIYADNLEDLDPRDLGEAFAAAEKCCRGGFLPSPAELREMADVAAQVRREDARRKAEAREREERRQLEAARNRGELMGLGDFVHQLREERPELVGLASRLTDGKRGPIATETDEAAQIRREREVQARHIQFGIEFLCELKTRARAEGISLKAFEVGR